MPRQRPSAAIWRELRAKVWTRDGGKCVHCGVEVTLRECHIDHIKSGLFGNNKPSNLRTLCVRCHVLRLDFRHRGMIAWALKKGIIGPDWRDHLWAG